LESIQREKGYKVYSVGSAMRRFANFVPTTALDTIAA
jgi:hypothetical protein